MAGPGREWYRESVELHRQYSGKIEVLPRVPLRGFEDFSYWYTPGVAEPVREIARDRGESFELSNRWNTIAIMSDGTRVLGLGSVGPEAALPVMEGKALLFKYLGGVDAYPLVHRARRLEEFLRLLEYLEPSFGGVNIEDVESPKCFKLLDAARERLGIPVWHDDQQGTAAAVLAGMLNAAKVTGRRLEKSVIVLLGAGAANIGLYRLLKSYGLDPRNVRVYDSKGLLHPERDDVDRLMIIHPYKYLMATETRGGGLDPGASVEAGLEGADILVAASRPGPGVVKPGWIRGMSGDPIVFALANPVPEIWPWEARGAGARVVATGRSDLPNQVNNSLVFPGLFRGVLDSRARAITDGMVVSAAVELSKIAEDEGLSEDHILPSMASEDVHPRVAAAVASKAAEEGVARSTVSYGDELEWARELIGRVREKLDKLMSLGLLRPLRRGR